MRWACRVLRTTNRYRAGRGWSTRDQRHGEPAGLCLSRGRAMRSPRPRETRPTAWDRGEGEGGHEIESVAARWRLACVWVWEGERPRGCAGREKGGSMYLGLLAHQPQIAVAHRVVGAAG
eukprot:scaffold17307_cov63-Phaeocystis_antarctica.AAC.9